jgi:hypothetical protein
MINSIILYNLRNGEYSQFMQDIIKLVSQNNPGVLQVKPQLTVLEGVASEIEALFKVPVGSAFTAELEALDLERDNALKGVLCLIRANLYSDDPVVYNHAAVLDTHVAMFGKDITTDSYQSETSSIRNILDDWNAKPELSAALTALNLQSWKARLETANNNFSEKYLQRAVELGADNADSIKAKRLEANEAYYKLRDNINARYTISEGAEPYKTVVSSVNGLLTYYNDLLARRGGGSGDVPPVTPAPGA